MATKKIKIIALIGEAGSGKDFLLRCALNKYPEYHEIISCTTRPPRMGELHGRNYYFLSDEEFSVAINEKRMLETASFNGWCYGTSLDSLDPDKINIGVFNPTGVRSLLKNDNIEVKVFYVSAPAKTRLLRQLNREDNPNIDEVIRRYQTDKQDFYDLSFSIPYEIIDNSGDYDINKSLIRLKWPSAKLD